MAHKESRNSCDVHGSLHPLQGKKTVAGICVGLTQFLVLIISQDQDDVWPDVAAVPLEAGLQPLAAGNVDVAQRRKDEQETEESARHGLGPLSPAEIHQSAALKDSRLWKTTQLKLLFCQSGPVCQI